MWKVFFVLCLLLFLASLCGNKRGLSGLGACRSCFIVNEKELWNVTAQNSDVLVVLRLKTV